LDNLNHAGFYVNEPPSLPADASFELPELQHSLDWIEQYSDRSIVIEGTVERSTASHLITLLQRPEQTKIRDLKPMLEALMRNIELRRQRCLQLRNGGSPIDRWFELHDTVILMARAASRYNDIRYLNAAIKLIDWALPVHRRSVPVDLLARYILAVSEVQSAFEELI
jgi:hypothetical protein